MDMSRAFQSLKGKGFDKVISVEFKNDEVTKERIEAAQEFLAQAKPTDVCIAFFAGHGLLDKNQQYFFGTYDIDFQSPEIRGLPYSVIDHIFDKTPARSRLLMLDTCHSGDIDEAAKKEAEEAVRKGVKININGNARAGSNSASVSSTASFDLMKDLFADLRQGSGAIVLAASGGFQIAAESNQNGFFTSSVLDVLSGKGKFKNTNEIKVSDLVKQVREMVVSKSQGVQKPTTRQENIDGDFLIMAIPPAKRVTRPEPKPTPARTKKRKRR